MTRMINAGFQKVFKRCLLIKFMLTLKVFFLIYWKNFLSNIVKNLKIREYKNLNSNIENIKDLAFRVILKYKNYPSVIAIKEK